MLLSSDLGQRIEDGQDEHEEEPFSHLLMGQAGHSGADQGRVVHPDELV